MKSLAHPPARRSSAAESTAARPEGAYALQLQGSPRQVAQHHLIQSLFPAAAERPSASSVVQGRFFAGYNVLDRQHLDPVWVELLMAVPTLGAATQDYLARANSPNDEGTFYQWVRRLVEQLAVPQAQQPALAQDGDAIEVEAPATPWERVQAILANRGIEDGELRGALRAMGAIGAGPQRPRVPILNLEELKDWELAPEQQGQETPPSPREESRLLQIPRLFERLDRAFCSHPRLLPFFDYILGGGAAMAIKRPLGGRLGRASSNMRDIDMDFQVIPAGRLALLHYLQQEGIQSLPALMNRICLEMRAAINAIDDADLVEALRTDDVRVSGRNTVMFNKGDLEYSFHFVNEEELLGFQQLPVGDGHDIKVISDDSHWALTKSALRARLKRPDKIQKTLIDALVQMGPPRSPHHDERMTETAAIVFGGARRIGTARNTLRRLAGPEGPPDDQGLPQWGRQAIVGLPNADDWQRHLDVRTQSHYDRDLHPELNGRQITDVREDYRLLFDEILQSIVGAAGGRPDVALNAHILREQVAARFDAVRDGPAYGFPTLATRHLYPVDEATVGRQAPVQHAHTLPLAAEEANGEADAEIGMDVEPVRGQGDGP